MIALATLDYVLLAVVFLSALIGLFRGIFREAMSLVVWITAVWVAARYAAAVAPHLADLVANAQIRIWGARLLLLIAVLITGGIVTLVARCSSAQHTPWGHRSRRRHGVWPRARCRAGGSRDHYAQAGRFQR